MDIMSISNAIVLEPFPQALLDWTLCSLFDGARFSQNADRPNMREF
jgi:hypothetical protein